MADKIPHIDGILHATGKSQFISDMPPEKDLVYVYPVFSNVSRGEIVEIDFSESEKIDGFIDKITCKDIPGENNVGVVEKGEPVFPEEEVEFFGQPVCAVIAKDYFTARKCAKLVKIKYIEKKPILTIEEAIEKNSFFKPQLNINRGNVKKGFKESQFVIEGKLETPIQEHFYLETQTCRVIPLEKGFLIKPSSQSPSEIQEIIASVLNIPQNLVTVDIKRLGGGFGGKEHNPGLYAAITAVASFKVKRPVELRLMRDDDITATGKRHKFKAKYRCGFNKDGKIKALEYEIYSNGGAYVDLSIPVLERCVLHSENAYFIENFKLKATACKTNLHPFTAFRGFGGPQGVFFMESIIEKIAKTLNLDPMEIRKKNLYKSGDRTPYGQKIKESYLQVLFEKIEPTYKEWKKEVEEFNQKNKFEKMGIAITPIKFGISFTIRALNRGYALIILYPDGTVSVSHGGIEMGQEVSTRVAQIVSKTIGISVKNIHIESANTKRIANIPPTAASTAVDLNGNAAFKSAKILRRRLERVAKKIFKEKFNISCEEIKMENDICKCEGKEIPIKEVIERAIWDREKMAEYQFYKTPEITDFNEEKGKGHPFYYYVFGVAVSVVKTDLLTGEFKLLKTKIIHEMGNSINRDVDMGQITGAYIQGMGWLTLEDMVYKEGVPISISPSTYKIPTISDIPEVFDVELFISGSKYSSIFGTKGIGEPPFLYGESVFFAIKNAIEDGEKKDSLLTPPATPENILKAINTLKLKREK